MKLEVLDGTFAICRAGAVEDIPWRDDFLFAARTDTELSLVCRTASVPGGAAEVSPGWRALRVAGDMDLNLLGVLAELSALLSKAGVSLFAVSTYGTDYLLVREGALTQALCALRSGGHEVAGYVIRPLSQAEVPAAMALCARVFDAYDAPDDPPEATAAFHAYVDGGAQRAARGEFICWGCFDGGTLAGVAATRGGGHISLLFVDGAFQRRGVARQLVGAASEGQGRMTVHAAPSAAAAYERLGFTATGGERVENGIRYVPMERAGKERTHDGEDRL